MPLINRVIRSLFNRYLSSFPAVGLTGPRQSGKSTFLQNELTDYRYITFDNPQNIEYFETDPAGFIKEYANKVIFDEAQLVPKLFHYVKMAIDQDRQNYGKFVLSGSSQFHLLNHIAESLAGRIGLLTLLPLQLSEIPGQYHRDTIFKGCYPELILNNYHERRLWYGSYFDTYVNKDVRRISNITNIRDFQRLIHMLAVNTAQILDMSSYAKELGISVPTIKRWLSILEASYIIYLLPPYYKNFNKRIIKSPKIYFYDTGLVSYLTGITTFDQYDKGPMAGAIFENYVITEIIKNERHHGHDCDFYYIRTSEKIEVDLIIDRKSSLDYIEIKKSGTFSPKMTSPIKKFITNQDRGFILYNGDRFPYHDNINIINYQDFLLG
jgi:uncharacterized protein